MTNRIEMRPIPSAPGCYADIDGHIWSERSGTLIRLLAQRRKDGYLSLNVVDATTGSRRTRAVHSLVGEAWLGLPSPGMEINHLDSNRSNNAPRNLQWVTKSQNVAHTYRFGSGVVRRGSSAHGAKLDDATVMIIRQRINITGETYRSLGKAFGVSASHVARIVQYTKWQHVRDYAPYERTSLSRSP